MRWHHPPDQFAHQLAGAEFKKFRTQAEARAYMGWSDHNDGQPSASCEGPPPNLQGLFADNQQYTYETTCTPTEDGFIMITIATRVLPELHTGDINASERAMLVRRLFLRCVNTSQCLKHTEVCRGCFWFTPRGWSSCLPATHQWGRNCMCARAV